MARQGLIVALLLLALPAVAWAHRPGPDILYAPPADAPQLENTGPWKAPPILVSGASAYRGGEFLYQDYLYDDHGAAGVPDNNNPIGPNAFLFSPPAGTFTYPTSPVYANNAADLVEFRVRPLADATAFRITLNTLKDPDRTAFTIALGSSAAPLPWPHGAGVTSPAALFLTVHGSSAELVDAVTGAVRSPAPAASVDLTRRQIEVLVPHAAWDPGGSTVRMTIGVGLWNQSAGKYLAPANGQATADTPGGGGAPSGAAIVNVGPRFDEPWRDPTFPPNYSLADAAVQNQLSGRSWRERKQADALRTGDLSDFHADVDFSKLAAGANDDSGVPKTGAMDRILASHYQFGQGLDPSKVCYDLAANYSAGPKCIGRLVGQLQPYALYVPNKPQPPHGYGLTLLLHALSDNYNEYGATRNQSEMGDRGAGSIVMTPSGRGPDGFYQGIAEADTFETWADVARHYDIDPDWTAVSGYSMGGYGTYRMIARWPDLFARATTTVAIPGTANDQLASLRNIPIMNWNAAADELVPIDRSEKADSDLNAAGLRFIHWLFPQADHLTLASNDEYAPQVAFLGDHRVDRDPPHVTYVVDPTEDSSAAEAIGDHAYWLSDLTVRAATPGTIDVRSEGFGVGDPKPLDEQPGGGTLDGGSRGPMSYASRDREWGPTPKEPVRNVLDVDAKNVRTATIDASRARVSCGAKLNVKTDGPLDVTLTGCSRGHSPGPGCGVRHAYRFGHRRHRVRALSSRTFTVCATHRASRRHHHR